MFGIDFVYCREEMDLSRKKFVPGYYAKNIARTAQRRFLKRKAQEKAVKQAGSEKANPKLV